MRPNIQLPNTPNLSSDHSKTRKSLLQERRNLSKTVQKKLAKQATVRLLRHPRYLYAKRMAIYLPIKNEIDIRAIIKKALRAKKKVYAPVIVKWPKGCIRFYRYRGKTHLGKYGIPMPPSQRRATSIKQLSLIIIPLVAYDTAGHRLGFGKGYYDRALAFSKLTQSRAPFKLGVAYDFQEVAALHPQPWDVALDAVITNKKTWDFKNQASEKHHPSRLL